MPKVGLTMTEGSITEWHKREGEFVKKGELLFNFETEKSTLEYESPAEGVLQKILVPLGQVTACYVPVAVIGERIERPISPRAKLRAKELGVDVNAVNGSGPESAVRERDVVAAAEQSRVTSHKSQVRATPVARRIADELGVDLALLTGTGRNGEITREDVEKTTGGKWQTTEAVAPQSPTLRQAQDAVSNPSTSSGGSLQSLSPARRVTAQRMAENARTAPHVTLTTEADASALMSAREQVSAEMGEKLSYNALLVAIVAKALREHPSVNASWDESRVISHESVHIGLAVDTPKGLFVPVVKDAGAKSLAQIHRELNDLVSRTLEGNAKLDELRGGTFTITNLGMFEIDTFTPIINLPEAAILGVGRIVKRAVVETAPNGDAHQNGDKIVARAMLTLSLSFDHRVVDGAPAAKFLQRIKQLIERPMALLV